jgi:Domain of unknown function (DUF4260)
MALVRWDLCPCCGHGAATRLVPVLFVVTDEGLGFPVVERSSRRLPTFAPPPAQPAGLGAGVVTGLPLVLLRSEGVALLAMAAVLYSRYGRSWWLFVALLPAPDLGLLGSLWSRRAGAVAYDLTHSYVGPAALGVVGLLTSAGLAIALALVWFAHIGMDRALGLGLQYPDGSGRTHLRGTRRGRADQGMGGDE